MVFRFHSLLETRVIAVLFVWFAMGVEPISWSTGTYAQETPAAEASPTEDEGDEVPATVAGDESASEQAASTEPTLTIGDEAPPLKIASWALGDAVDGFQKDHIYVVEFWATWCGPCLASMPHVSKLQEEYRDRATFIGVSSEDEETVTSFLDKVQDDETEKKWRDILTYRLAMDDGEETTKSYTAAAKENGIPCAFVVGRDSRIEWIGHPMELDDVLAKVDAKSWDRDAFKVAYQQQKASERLVEQAALAMRGAMQDGNWDSALAALDEALAAAPEQLILEMWKMTALLKAQRHDEVLAQIKGMREKHADNAQLLNALAWEMVTKFEKEHRDLDMALEIAERSNSLTDGMDPSVLDTLARVMFERGEVAKAIELQRKAIELAPGMRQLTAALEQYEKALAEQEEEKVKEPAATEEK